MTVIAFDGKSLAADTMRCSETTKQKTTKIKKLSNGKLFAFAGRADIGAAMESWVESGVNIGEFPNCQEGEDWCTVIVVEKNRQAYLYQQTPHKIIIEDDFFAIGSGEAYALAAMYLGKSAKAAVQVAIDLCPSCGGKVQEVLV